MAWGILKGILNARTTLKAIGRDIARHNQGRRTLAYGDFPDAQEVRDQERLGSAELTVFYMLVGWFLIFTARWFVNRGGVFYCSGFASAILGTYLIVVSLSVGLSKRFTVWKNLPPSGSPIKGSDQDS
jgi:hypothetical protein